MSNALADPEGDASPASAGGTIKQAMTAELNSLMADLYTLELRALACKHEASGLHSYGLQDMLDKHASSLHAGIRAIVARASGLNTSALCNLRDLANHQRLSNLITSELTRSSGLLQMFEGNQQLVEYLKEAHALFDAHGDITGTRLIAGLLESAEQRSFELFQLLKQN